jgi:hypothetical protein
VDDAVETILIETFDEVEVADVAFYEVDFVDTVVEIVNVACIGKFVEDDDMIFWVVFDILFDEVATDKASSASY